MTEKLHSILVALMEANRGNRELKIFLRKYQRLAPQVFEIGTIINEYEHNAPKIVNIRGLTPRLQGELDKHDEAVKNYVEPPKPEKTLFTRLYEAQKNGSFKVRKGKRKQRAENREEYVTSKLSAQEKKDYALVKRTYEEIGDLSADNYFALSIIEVDRFDPYPDIRTRTLTRLRNSHYENKKEEKENDTRQPKPTSDGDLQISA